MSARYNRRSGRGRYKKYFKQKVCGFCTERDVNVDYKNAGLLKQFVTDRGKIIPRRITGVCAKHQRELTTAIKRARQIALLPYTVHYK